MILHARNPDVSSITSVIGLITLLFAASQVFAELQTALNKIWEVDARHTSGVLTMIRERFFSFGLVLAIGLLLVVSLLVSAGLAAVGQWSANRLALPAWTLHAFNFLVSLVGTSLLFALIFKYVPDDSTRWARSRARRRDYRLPVRCRQNPHRLLPGRLQHALHLRGRGLVRRAGGLGVLLLADLLLRCRAHVHVDPR
jgi:Virulence factor BrkB